MKLFIPTTVLLAKATTMLPAARAWSITPFESMASRMLREQMALMDRALNIANDVPATPSWGLRPRVDSNWLSSYGGSPRYAVHQDDNKLEISLDIPGVKAEDVNVRVEHDGKVLSITGHREVKTEGSYESAKFAQQFSIDRTIDVDKIQANLADGVLVVTAPKDLSRLEAATRQIPILTESKAPTLEASSKGEHEEKAEVPSDAQQDSTKIPVNDKELQEA